MRAVDRQLKMSKLQKETLHSKNQSKFSTVRNLAQEIYPLGESEDFSSVQNSRENMEM